MNVLINGVLTDKRHIFLLALHCSLFLWPSSGDISEKNLETEEIPLNDYL